MNLENLFCRVTCKGCLASVFNLQELRNRSNLQVPPGWLDHQSLTWDLKLPVNSDLSTLLSTLCCSCCFFHPIFLLWPLLRVGNALDLHVRLKSIENQLLQKPSISSSLSPEPSWTPCSWHLRWNMEPSIPPKNLGKSHTLSAFSYSAVGQKWRNMYLVVLQPDY